MKAILIVATLFATLLTFYSALRFKSEAIEADISTRVSDGLASANAKAITVDVDGRHVTLAGVVHDATEEETLLGVADDTYGALGPVDGLSYVAASGFVTATKTDAGVTLKGTVPDEETRSALSDIAARATDGDVTDELVVSGSAGAWHDEAQFGLGQLAALSSGSMTAGPGALVLSGTATEDPGAITSELEARGAWQSFIAAPDVSDQIAELETQLAAVDGALADRTSALSDLQANFTTYRDTLEAEVEAQTALLEDRDGTIERLNAEMAGLRTEFGTERDTFQAQIDTERTLSSDLSAQLEQLRAGLTDGQVETSELSAELTTVTASLVERDATIAQLTNTIEGLEADLAGLRAEQSEGGAELDALRTNIAALEENLGAQSALVAERDETIGGLNADLENLRAGLSAEEASVSTLNADLAAQTALVAERDSTIEGLNGELESLRTGLSAEAAVLDTLRSELGERNGLVQALVGDLESLNGYVAEQDGTIETLQAELAGRNDLVQDLTGDLESLNGYVAEQNGVIGTLQAELAERPGASTAPSPQVVASVDQCAARAATVIRGTQINFVTGSANISSDSEALLERLTGIALACINDNVVLEIGGHTDDQGEEARNQDLSERRAAAVVAFMEERGVPATGLVSAGFGESQPIADNGTSEGRAANRRISFGWQAR